MTDKTATSSQQDFLASHIPLPGSAEAMEMTARSGMNLFASLTSADQNGPLVKTFMASSQWASSKCYLTWKVSAIGSSHLLFRLAPSTPPIDEIESGLLHTPTATRNQLALSMQKHPGSWLWPTPSAGDNRDRGNLSTPAIQRRAEKGKQLNLSMVVSGQSGSLNPAWVEWLMGYPEGWTDLKD